LYPNQFACDKRKEKKETVCLVHMTGNNEDFNSKTSRIVAGKGK
jgi:hypothetical protein